MKRLNEHNTNTPAGLKAILLAGCLGIGLICQPAMGQLTTGTSTNWTYAYNYGNSWAGGYGSFSIVADNERVLLPVFDSNELGLSDVQVASAAGVSFLTLSMQAEALQLRAHNDSGLVKFDLADPPQFCSRSFKVAGFTVDSGVQTTSYSASKGFTTSFWNPSVGYTIGPVSATINGSVGAGASMGYALQVPANGASISATPTVWITGGASANATALGCGAKLNCTLNLAQTTFNPVLAVTPETITAQASVNFTPVSVGLNLFAYLFGLQVGNATLVNYTMPAYVWPVVTPLSISNITASGL